jgi:phytoene synthase
MPDPSEDLDALVARVDPDRWLSSRFIDDPQARADVIAIYAFDHELARVPKVASNALLGEIRLTWWREVLDQIFEGRPVRLHPTAQALAGVVGRHGLPREPLDSMIDARYRELDAGPMTAEEATDWARGSAGAAASLAARILDPRSDPSQVASAGAAWALALRMGADAEQRARLAPALKVQLALARREVRGLSIAAYPAAAHAALAGRRSRGAAAAPWSSRLRLILSVATGRI